MNLYNYIRFLFAIIRYKYIFLYNCAQLKKVSFLLYVNAILILINVLLFYYKY